MEGILRSRQIQNYSRFYHVSALTKQSNCKKAETLDNNMMSKLDLKTVYRLLSANNSNT